MTEVAGPDQSDELLATPRDADWWARLGPAEFRAIVAHLRRAWTDLEDHEVTPAVARLRALPIGKLSAGAGRRQVMAELARGGPLWHALRARLGRDDDLVARLAAADDPPDEQPSTVPGAGDLQALRAARDDARAQRDDARARLDEVRQERDRAQRAQAGAEGREQSLAEQLEGLRADLAAARDELAGLRAENAELEGRAATASQRASRQAELATEQLRAQLAEARRDLDDANRTIGRLERRLAARDDSQVPPAAPAASATPRVWPGRPSQLDASVRTDTTAGARELLQAVGTLWVDGYNVTRQHRGDLPLAEQRRWLVDGLVALAARLRLDVAVVFDAHEGGAPSGSTRRGVRVQFTAPGTTADDELVFAAAAAEPDRPIVVATDDAELRARLAGHGVDLLHTAPLRWLLS